MAAEVKRLLHGIGQFQPTGITGHQPQRRQTAGGVVGVHDRAALGKHGLVGRPKSLAPAAVGVHDVDEVVHGDIGLVKFRQGSAAGGSLV